ncbi:MAG TPA: hypothetical protein VNT30_05195 [Stellaceae bacterium]|nr:hypothetical protein [Stellaceae bacterium]
MNARALALWCWFHVRAGAAVQPSLTQPDASPALSLLRVRELSAHMQRDLGLYEGPHTALPEDIRYRKFF